MKNEILRRFCTDSSCAVWQAIKDFEGKKEAFPNCEDKFKEGTMRQFCIQNCQAYRYHEYLKRCNLEIVAQEGKNRYV